MRRLAIVIGVFLMVVWVAGLSVHARGWLTWLDLVAGLVALAIGLLPADRADTRTMRGLPIVISLGLLAPWIAGLVTHAQAWITWCTFVAACAMLAEAFGDRLPARRMHTA